MTTGDRIRLHIPPGRRETLDLPEEIGTIRSIEEDHGHAAVLIRFGEVLVYLWPVDEADVEVVSHATE